MSDETLTEDELKAAVRKIFKLSQTDPVFRALCLDDPKEAIRRIAGKPAPTGLNIRFLDSSPDSDDKSRGPAA